jgi:CRISPR/Cas system-associated exonuclease Cas4 (RecB family)
MTKKLTLSPSKVDTFMGCKRLYKYRYISVPFTPPQNKYFVIGNIAHKALELYHKERFNDKIGRLGGWKRFMGECFKEAMKRENARKYLRDSTISKDDLLSIRDMLKNYVNHIKKTGAPTVALVEKLAKVNIEGIDVWLKADRVDSLGEKEYKVVDYKSGRPSTKKGERESVQIPSYGLFIKQHVHKNPTNIFGEYCYIKHLDKKNGISAHEVTQEWMDDAASKYKSVYNEITSGKCKFRQNFKYKFCRFCDFKKYCLEDDDDGI